MLNTVFPTPLRAPGAIRLAREMDQVLKTAVALSAPTTDKLPGMNVWRQDDSIVVEAEIPGFAKSDVEILATSDSLTVRGRRQTSAPQNAAPLHLEHQITSFERTLNLGLAVDADGVRAELVNGVLRVTLPVAEAARPRRVKIAGEPAAPRSALAGGTSGKDDPAR